MAATKKTKKLYILDTNVPMSDPTALFKFDDNDLYLPMIVVEELDNAKKGFGEPNRNARHFSRIVDGLMEKTTDFSAGLSLQPHNKENETRGRRSGSLFFETETLDIKEFENRLDKTIADNKILFTALALKEKYPDKKVILVSKDTNVRIKAKMLGLLVEDYKNDKVLDDIDLLYSGKFELPADFWETHKPIQDVEVIQQTGQSVYYFSGPLVEKWHTQELLYGENPFFEATVQSITDNVAKVITVKSFYKHDVFGILSRNREQNVALNYLLDPSIHLVALLGDAGVGKTLLALAAGLSQVMEDHLYDEIIMTRNTVPLGEEIGFLPGTEEQKMEPWMGALRDNMELLIPTHAMGIKDPPFAKKSGKKDKASDADITHDIVGQYIKVKSLNFMRGRTFLGRYVILDESQNLTPKQMKTLISRAGPKTKIIVLGNNLQIDDPYISATTSGLTHLVEKAKSCEFIACITFEKCERSVLAEWANQNL